MKVVINAKTNGLDFTVDEWYEYYNAIGKPLFWYYISQQRYRDQPELWVKCERDFVAPELVGKQTVSPPLSRYQITDIDYGDMTEQYPSPLPEPSRTCPVLVDLVEQMKVNDDLIVVNVPDDVEWYIDVDYLDDSGNFREIVRQTHAIWS